MKLQLKEGKNITKVFLKNLKEWQEKKNRIIVNEGGTGSSKTYSLAQLVSLIMVSGRAKITIARKTFPSLRATAMKDFFAWLRTIGIYKEEWHNKSENIYTYPPTGSEVDFLSVDEPTRIRSRRRNYLWMNEANEFTKEDYMQLAMRTDKQIFMDYNPSHQYHWIYDELQPRDDCAVIQSTYKDNPFLVPEIVKEIEKWKEVDRNYWRIYGLGLKGLFEALIYTHWQFCNSLPENPDKVIYGLDFGFNNPTALVRIVIKDQDYYWDEILYESGLTNQDLIQKLKQLNLPSTQPIYADSAEPQRIEEIHREGFYILPSNKGAVKDGIDAIKSRKFFITKSSVNLLREVKSYSWKTKDDKRLEEPIKDNDHLLDGGRYAVVSELSYTPSKFPKQNLLQTPVDKKAIPSSAGLWDREF